MDHTFDKEDIYTGGGFVLDSFEAHQAEFVDVTSEEDFGATFLAEFTAAHAAVKGLTGAGLGIGATSQLTQQLYGRLDGALPWLNKLDIRLGLMDPKTLTVPVKDFGLATLRKCIGNRNAEGAVTALGTLNKLIGANLAVLEPRGHKAADTAAFVEAELKIAEDNRAQNKGQNSSTKATVDENAVLVAFDGYLKKVMRTGRKLYKKTKQARRQYEQTALLSRMHAGERPKDRPGTGE